MYSLAASASDASIRMNFEMYNSTVFPTTLFVILMCRLELELHYHVHKPCNKLGLELALIVSTDSKGRHKRTVSNKCLHTEKDLVTSQPQSKKELTCLIEKLDTK